MELKNVEGVAKGIPIEPQKKKLILDGEQYIAETCA